MPNLKRAEARAPGTLNTYRCPQRNAFGNFCVLAFSVALLLPLAPRCLRSENAREYRLDAFD